MHQPQAHPSTTPAHSGKARRYVLNTTAIRPVRLDSDSDAALLWLKAQLSGSTARDAASCSLVVRRAVRLYRRHVASLLADRQALESEKATIRQLSKLPTPTKRSSGQS